MIRSPMRVSFSGIDGAGKSTQIANLTARLREAGLQVRLVTFWDDIATLKSLRESVGHKVFKGDKGVGTPAVPIQRRDKNVRSPFMTLVRMGFYLIDVVSLRRVTYTATTSEADVIIFDRYIYDECANLDARNPMLQLYLRAILYLAPKPHISFILDADPTLAYARKPEYPLDFLHSNRSSYLRLASFVPGVEIVPPSSVDQVKTLVERQVFGKWAALHPAASAAQ